MKLAGKTDVGRVRQENQDDYRAGELPGGAVWALVCDGMGGAKGGREASQGACNVIEQVFQEQYAQQWQASRSTDPETVEYLYRYVITGSIGILQNWLKSGMRKSPGEMAGLLLRLTNQGLAAFS